MPRCSTQSCRQHLATFIPVCCLGASAWLYRAPPFLAAWVLHCQLLVHCIPAVMPYHGFLICCGLLPVCCCSTVVVLPYNTRWCGAACLAMGSPATGLPHRPPHPMHPARTPRRRTYLPTHYHSSLGGLYSGFLFFYFGQPAGITCSMAWRLVTFLTLSANATCASLPGMCRILTWLCTCQLLPPTLPPCPWTTSFFSIPYKTTPCPPSY